MRAPLALSITSGLPPTEAKARTGLSDFGDDGFREGLDVLCGALEGEVKASPSDWSFAGDYGFVELETRPEEPYSVNIAFTVIDRGASFLARTRVS